MKSLAEIEDCIREQEMYVALLKDAYVRYHTYEDPSEPLRMIFSQHPTGAQELRYLMPKVEKMIKSAIRDLSELKRERRAITQSGGVR
jgi:hypothetical protein